MWESPDEVGYRFGYTAQTAATAPEVQERFAEMADIAAEQGTGDPLCGRRIRRHGHLVDLGLSGGVPDGFPGLDLDRDPEA